MKGDYLTDSDYALWNEPALNISEQDIIEELETFSHRMQRRNKGRKTVFTVVAALGALVSLTLGVGVGVHLASDMTEGIAWSEVCVKKGAQQELLLPDGSKVILAPGSRLLYPERFAGKERHVYMDGEILFDVVTDQDCPFKVSANSTEISVSGTIFNVKAYHLDEAQTISLMEGSIEVSSALSASSVKMTQGSALSVDIRTGDMQMFDLPESKYPAWYKGEYNAYNEPLSRIALDLERIFDVDIVFRNKSLENQVFYLSIVDASSIDNILTALSRSGKVKVRKEDNIIYLN